MWNKKTRHYFKPKYYDNPGYYGERRWDQTKNISYNTQNPLFFDYDKLYLNGGIQPYIDKIKETGKNNIPVNKRAYILYHMAKQGVYDPEFFKLMEGGLMLEQTDDTEENDLKGEKHLTARYAMGAVIGYWRLNTGSAWALKYWENSMLS